MNFPRTAICQTFRISIKKSGDITTENSELASEHTVKLLESFDALSDHFQEGIESTQ